MNGKEIQQTNRSYNKREVPKARHHVSQYSCALPCRYKGATHVDMLTTLDILPCHCEAERSEAVAIARLLDLNEITTSCATHTARNDKNLSCHRDVLAEGSQDNPSTLALPPTLRFGNRVAQLVPRWLPLFFKGGRENFVSEAHGKELNVLKSYRLNDFKKKVAFTLAEVLITLGIIGIVAAMTIPTLISNYKSVQLQSQLKKTYSSLSQAVNMIYAESGLPVTPARYSQGLSFYKDLMKYMKVAEDCGKFGCISYEVEDGSAVSFVIEHYKTYDLSGNIESMYFDDGQFILQDGTLVMCENVTDNLFGLLITADINGTEKGPNAWGHDLFTFEVQDSRLVPSGAKGTHFDLELYPDYCSEESSSSKNGIACTEKALTDHDYFKNLPK